MISFACHGCGRSFAVPDGFAGRHASCKSCGSPLLVPSAPPVTTNPPTQGARPRIPLRIRRLNADAKQMAESFAASPFIRVRGAVGNPPDAYQIEYLVRGLQRGRKNRPVPREQHLVEIRLHSEYPRLSPRCKVLTPIFHPNIDPTTICVGDHWTAGERLADLVVRIAEMIAYQAYNIKSPLDAEAAMWADLHADELPIDSRNLYPSNL